MRYLIHKAVSSGLNNLNARRLRPALLTGLFFISSVCMVETVVADNNSFSDGIKAFKLKQYPDALNYFLAAEKITPAKNSLLYNIAVTYYKLKAYRQAETYFLRLTASPQYKQFAQYNLGRTSIQLGKKDQAIKYFQAAAKGSRKKLVLLANRQLGKLSVKKIASMSFDGAVQLSIGNDSNVLLTPDESPSQTSDSYTDAVAYVDLNLAENITLSASYNNQNYQTINSVDYKQIGLSVSKRYKLSDWRLTPELATNRTDLGGNSYLTVNELKFSAKNRLSKTSKLSMRYRYSDIESRQARYDYLSGERHQFRVDYKSKEDIGRLRYRYQLEVNDRQDTAINSYSPTRQTLRIRLKKKLVTDWLLSSELGFRHSEYPSVVNVKRVDNRLRIRLGTEYLFAKGFRAKAQFVYTENNSNIISKEYSRQVYELGLSYYF